MRPLRHDILARTRARAFTLLEVIAVIIVLAVLASITIPRMTGNERRQFRLTVDQVGDLLTMYAQRQNLGAKVVGLYHNRAIHSLELVILDTDDGYSGQQANWRVDPYVPSIPLPRFMMETDFAIVANGEIIDASEYPLSSEIGQDRPWIEIHMRGAGESAVLSLAPYGVAPMLTSSYLNAGVVRSRYDLDRAGRSREDW
jgi:prepilin-type N-terminal cleavage/methylation domain-containing protein